MNILTTDVLTLRSRSNYFQFDFLSFWDLNVSYIFSISSISQMCVVLFGHENDMSGHHL